MRVEVNCLHPIPGRRASSSAFVLFIYFVRCSRFAISLPSGKCTRSDLANKLEDYSLAEGVVEKLQGTSSAECRHRIR